LADKFRFIKKVIAGGCSFTHGSELEDYNLNNPENDIIVEASKHTWADHVTKNLFKNATLDNVAWPGIGYESIVRRVIYQCEKNLKKYKPQDIVVLIMWSSVLRREFVSITENEKTHNEEYFLNSLPSDGDGKLSLGVNKDGKFTKERSKKWNNEKLSITVQNFYLYRNTYENRIYTPLQQLEYLNFYLKSKGIPYFYTCAFDDIRKNYKSDNIFIQNMIERTNINNLYFKVNDNGFYTWAKNNNYKCGQLADHPLEDAHKDWATYFSNYILTKRL